MGKHDMTDYREPSWMGRAVLIGLVLMGVSLSVAIDLWLKPYLAHIDTLPLCDRLPPLRWIVLCAMAACWACGALMARAAVSTFRSGESPFPGALVWFRKRISRGWRANLDAAIIASMAVAFIVGPIVGFFCFGANVIFCWPESCGC